MTLAGIVALCLVLVAPAPAAAAASSAELPVLEWLSSLPFGLGIGAGAAPPTSNVRLGEPHPTLDLKAAPAAAPPPADASSPPLPAAAGTPLSDTFRWSSLRRGLHATRDFANGTEILRVPFDAMFNYSSPFAPQHPLPAAFTDLLLTSVHSGAVLDSQALLALRVLLQYQQQHEWAKDAAANADKLHWAPLFASLPRPSSVCFFTQEELAELQIPIESPVFAARAQQLDTLSESFAAFDELIRSKAEYAALFPSGFTERWYRWAYGLVLNTAAEVPIRDEEGADGALLVLVPALLQINHANPRHTNARLEWNYDHAAMARAVDTPPGPDGKRPLAHGSGSLSLRAMRDVKAGEELLITYGSLTAIPLLPAEDPHNSTHSSSVEAHTARDRHHNDSSESHFSPDSFFQQIGLSNSQLLVHYGLALPTNDYERVALDIGLDADVAGVAEHHYDVLELKRQIIDLNELDHGTLVGLDGRLDPFFIQALRTKHLSSEDLAHLAHTDYEFAPQHGYLSLQNELKWQLQLVVSIENLLTAYPTTLQADIAQINALLQAHGKAAHGNNLVHAIAYRVALKRVLHSLILRSLSNIHELFLNISSGWQEALAKHDAEEEAQLALQTDLTPEARAQMLREWQAEQATWTASLNEWRTEMDKWESTWRGWVQSTMGSHGLLDSLPPHNIHKHALPDTLDELLDPSIHALHLEHAEEEVTVDVEDEAHTDAEHEHDLEPHDDDELDAHPAGTGATEAEAEAEHAEGAAEHDDDGDDDDDFDAHDEL